MSVSPVGGPSSQLSGIPAPHLNSTPPPSFGQSKFALPTNSNSSTTNGGVNTPTGGVNTPAGGVGTPAGGTPDQTSASQKINSTASELQKATADTAVTYVATRNIALTTVDMKFGNTGESIASSSNNKTNKHNTQAV